MRPSLRFVRSIEHEIFDWLMNFFVRYLAGKVLDMMMRKSWDVVQKLVSRLTWFFPFGIAVLAVQALTGLGFVSPPSVGVQILDQAIFVFVVDMGAILTFLGLSMGGPRRSFNGILIVGSRQRVPRSK